MHLSTNPLPGLRLIPGKDTTATPGLMPMDTTDIPMPPMDTMGRERLSLLLLQLLMLPLLMLMPGTDTTAGLMPTVMDTGLMAMDTTTEREMLSPLLMLLLPVRLMLMPGMDTTAMAFTDLMAMDTTDTGLMAMDPTTERGLLM